MRVLIDECVDQRLRLAFVGHECQTASYAGFAGLKNGALLSAAEEAGFDVLITVDQEMPYQQSLLGHGPEATDPERAPGIARDRCRVSGLDSLNSPEPAVRQ